MAEKTQHTPRMRKADRWREIITSATEVFCEKGYDAASLQDIADRVGILKGSIYYYIGSKDDLLAAVISEVHSGGIERVRILADTEGNALERLRRVIVGHILYVCENLSATRVFLHELDVLPEERRKAIVGEHSYQKAFRDLIVDGRREGVVRADIDPKLGALSLLGSLNWIYRWFRNDAEFTPREIATAFSSLQLHALGTPAAVAALPDEDIDSILARLSS